jgi:hypothetical protein
LGADYLRLLLRISLGPATVTRAYLFWLRRGEVRAAVGSGYLFACGTPPSHELPNIDVFTSSRAFTIVAATDVFISSMDFIMLTKDVFTSSVDFVMAAAMSRIAVAAGAGTAKQLSHGRSVAAGASWAISGLPTIA